MGGKRNTIIIYTTDPDGVDCRLVAARYRKLGHEVQVVELAGHPQRVMRLLCAHPELILPPIIVERAGRILPG